MILLLFLPFVCFAQKVTYGDNSVRIEDKTFLYFDAEGNPITDQAHRDSLETHKYVISIKGTDEIPEIHLVYKHPKLETLIGETLPKVGLSDISGKLTLMNPSIQLYVFGTGIVVFAFGNLLFSIYLLKIIRMFSLSG